jgi:hypothetical protein
MAERTSELAGCGGLAHSTFLIEQRDDFAEWSFAHSHSLMSVELSSICRMSCKRFKGRHWIFLNIFATVRLIAVECEIRRSALPAWEMPQHLPITAGILA